MKKWIALLLAAVLWKEAHRHLCCRCGRIFHSPGALCEACIKILHTEEQETARRLKKTWYLGAKDSAFGT